MRTPGPEAAEGVSAQTRHVLRAKLVNEPWCEEHIDAAFAGKVKRPEPDVGVRAIITGPRCRRTSSGRGARISHPGGARRALEPRSPPCAALSRETLSSRLIYEFGTRPSGLPKFITLWRGGLCHPRYVARGWSWTTDRNTACWFAVRNYDLFGKRTRLPHDGGKGHDIERPDYARRQRERRSRGGHIRCAQCRAGRNRSGMAGTIGVARRQRKREQEKWLKACAA